MRPEHMNIDARNPIDNDNEDFSDGYRSGWNQAISERCALCKHEILKTEPSSIEISNSEETEKFHLKICWFCASTLKDMLCGMEDGEKYKRVKQKEEV